MKKIVFVAALLGASAFGAHAQTSTAPSADGETPAIATPDQTNPTAPVAGQNSFTEAQAKERLEEAGYSNVTDLKLSEQGVWQASASKDGKPVKASMDYQGNIVAE
ncbi:PepSY domain-containing protein [Rhizobium sp. CECT 9324]|jgi:hypothetical protein|uniref:PepSY domain-containing protein n=1 Tax=Rhizobium sp. CECT 9324 TaxID=2845820 RepID=UPI000DE05C1E|nr:PepSY domain-containing protein [Rhizobium sp. CECT 9324]CAH0342508.1 hypothetical protein RHI9324_04232 [Rhizobium sp. CECT 9324]